MMAASSKLNSTANMTQTISTMKQTMNTIKGTGDFANSFWRFIKEEIGIHNVYPDGKKKVSYQERQAKVE